MIPGENLMFFQVKMREPLFSLRKKKLKHLDSNELRLLILQNFGLKYLVPIVINKLKENLFEEALYYPGDLLLALLNIEDNYWQQNIIQRENFGTLLKDNKYEIELKIPPNIKDETTTIISKFLQSSYN